jgi:hypothetical protein
VSTFSTAGSANRLIPAGAARRRADKQPEGPILAHAGHCDLRHAEPQGGT